MLPDWLGVPLRPARDTHMQSVKEAATEGMCVAKTQCAQHVPAITEFCISMHASRSARGFSPACTKRTHAICQGVLILPDLVLQGHSVPSMYQPFCSSIHMLPDWLGASVRPAQNHTYATGQAG